MRLFCLVIALILFAAFADAAPRRIVTGRPAGIVGGNRGRSAIVIGTRRPAAIMIGNRGVRRINRQNFIFRRQALIFNRQAIVVGGGYGTAQIVTGSSYATQQIVTTAPEQIVTEKVVLREEVAPPPVVVQRVVVQRVVTPSYGCGTSAVRFLRYH